MTTRTLAETLAIAASGLGTWWPNPWWPNGRSTYNDCAAFVSWALYGLNTAGQPVYTYVPHIMDRAIREGRWYGGKALTARPTTRTNAEGIQAGDVVIFDWRFRGSRDHVGIALAAPKDGGVRVRQANNGGGGTGRGDVRDPAEDVTYGTQFVLGYYRPPYKTPAPAGGSSAPITITSPEEDEMRIKRESTGVTYRVAPGLFIKHHKDTSDAKISGYLDTGAADRRGERALNEKDFKIALYDLGFAEVGGNYGLLPKNGGIHWARRQS